MRGTGLLAALLSLILLVSACDDEKFRDRVGPQVLWTSPDRDETGVAGHAPVTVQFDEALNVGTVTAENFTMGNTAPGLLVYDLSFWQVVLHPPDPAFSAGTTVEVRVAKEVRDRYGNGLVVESPDGEFVLEDFSFSYTVSDDEDPPEVIDTVPADGSTDVGLDRALEITFSEDLDPSTLGPKAMQVNEGTLAGVQDYAPSVGESADPDYVRATLTFRPDGGWLAASEVTVTLSSDIADLAGNKLVKIQSINFTTAASK